MNHFPKRITEYVARFLSPVNVPESWKHLANCRRKLTAMLHEHRYLAVSDISGVLHTCSGTLSQYRDMEENELLMAYCRRHRISCRQVEETLRFFDRLDRYVNGHNRSFIRETLSTEKEYFDHILDRIDPSIRLDQDQRRMIVTDEDYCLVIAGAGAGKTTAVAAKVRYLTEKHGILPEEILVISFTNKAVAELKQRIQKNLGINCPIATFHSTGNAILHREQKDRLMVADPSLKYTSIMKYFQRQVLRDAAMVHRIILFFSYYIDPPFDENDPEEFFRLATAKQYQTLRSELGGIHRIVTDIRTGDHVTIQNEVLRSRQEAEIANFLYLHGIEYEYEPLYPFAIPGAKKPYTPDFLIRQGDHICYLEHFGISENGQNGRYSEEELARYKSAANRKVIFHRMHGTELIFTFSSYRDGRPLTEHLEEMLLSHGFSFLPPDEKEILGKLFSQAECRSVNRFVLLITRFITNFKTDGYGLEEFDRMLSQADSVRNQLFLEICRACYLEYERVLTEQHATDFEDMINDSVRILREAIRKEAGGSGTGTERSPYRSSRGQEPADSQTKLLRQESADSQTKPLGFRYVIVDEYQDISRQRFDLVRALRDATGAKIMAVGDDWQSIYAFSGSDITLFTKFREKMGYGELLKIHHTYRNAQELIDIAGNFIQKNSSQLVKSLKSARRIADPVVVLAYHKYGSGEDAGTGSSKTGKKVDMPPGSAGHPIPHNLAEAAEMALDEIVAAHAGTSPDGSTAAAHSGTSPDGIAARAKESLSKKKPLSSLSILMLGRFGFDGYNLGRSDRFVFRDYGSRVISKKYPELRITYMTAHASKGLGYDEVILLNAKDERYGFPARIEDDPLLSYVVKEDHSYDYAEERRLFYVALTRTKNRVYLIAPSRNPSSFLKELLRDNPEIRTVGKISMNETEEPVRSRRCPLCGYPLILRFKPAYGLPLYICTNEPEICGFITNDLRGGTLQIRKCDCCQDGFLIVKRNRKTQQMFLGCTNYLPGGRGCNRSI